jgi:hypothetical protein
MGIAYGPLVYCNIASGILLDLVLWFVWRIGQTNYMVTCFEYMDFFTKCPYVLRLLQGVLFKRYSSGLWRCVGSVDTFQKNMVSHLGWGLHCVQLKIDVIWGMQQNFQRSVFGWLQIASVCTWILFGNPEDGIRMFIRNVSMNFFSIISKFRILSFKKWPLSPESVMSSFFFTIIIVKLWAAYKCFLTSLLCETGLYVYILYKSIWK